MDIAKDEKANWAEASKRRRQRAVKGEAGEMAGGQVMSSLEVPRRWKVILSAMGNH